MRVSVQYLCERVMGDGLQSHERGRLSVNYYREATSNTLSAFYWRGNANLQLHLEPDESMPNSRRRGDCTGTGWWICFVLGEGTVRGNIP